VRVEQHFHEETALPVAAKPKSKKKMESDERWIKPNPFPRIRVTAIPQATMAPETSLPPVATHSHILSTKELVKNTFIKSDLVTACISFGKGVSLGYWSPTSSIDKAPLPSKTEVCQSG
jgi:hypothetical protein